MAAATPTATVAQVQENATRIAAGVVARSAWYQQPEPARTWRTTVQDLHRMADEAAARGLRVFTVVSSGGWLVNSQSDQSVLYPVDPVGGCVCHGYQRHQRCSHYAALIAALGWLPDLPDPAGPGASAEPAGFPPAVMVRRSSAGTPPADFAKLPPPVEPEEFGVERGVWVSGFSDLRSLAHARITYEHEFGVYLGTLGDDRTPEELAEIDRFCQLHDRIGVQYDAFRIRVLNAGVTAKSFEQQWLRHYNAVSDALNLPGREYSPATTVNNAPRQSRTAPKPVAPAQQAPPAVTIPDLIAEVAALRAELEQERVRLGQWIDTVAQDDSAWMHDDAGWVSSYQVEADKSELLVELLEQKVKQAQSALDRAMEADWMDDEPEFGGPVGNGLVAA